jgi:hypothetical protein
MAVEKPAAHAQDSRLPESLLPKAAIPPYKIALQKSARHR